MSTAGPAVHGRVNRILSLYIPLSALHPFNEQSSAAQNPKTTKTRLPDPNLHARLRSACACSAIQLFLGMTVWRPPSPNPSHRHPISIEPVLPGVGRSETALHASWEGTLEQLGRMGIG